MTKIKKTIVLIVSVLLIWFAVGFTDYVLVVMEKTPIFCIKNDTYSYKGLGYSFEIVPHIVTEKKEYAYYIFGMGIENNFTN
ncbi:MAG: hypothetical protein K2K91_01170 [Ruminococcus sp.]|nr:hypothetical protein [Ruminococcus sp.]